jgi:hypothetical protein
MCSSDIRPLPLDERVELLAVFCNHVSYIGLVCLPTFIVLLLLKVFVPLDVVCCPCALGFLKCSLLSSREALDICCNPRLVV